MLLVTNSAHEEDLFRQALEKSGLRIDFRSVKTPHEAVSLLKGDPPFSASLRPHVIIIDLDSSQSDPIELLLWLQSKPEYKTVGTVVLTSRLDPAEVARAYSLDANAVATKPQNEEELLRFLTSLYNFWSMYEQPPQNLPRAA